MQLDTCCHFYSLSEIPEVHDELGNFITFQSNGGLQNEVVNFTPNFVSKLPSSLRSKFPPFGVVGLVI